ncbi:MAG: hypothetical protein HGA45_00785 [Chloroflexales bacterium]|nr:hypothetical protein [Chloroflexales bacterium]
MPAMDAASHRRPRHAARYWLLDIGLPGMTSLGQIAELRAAGGPWAW